MATLDLLTIDEAKAAVNLPTSSALQEEQLALWVTAISQRVDDLCGPVVVRTITDEIHYASGTDHIWPNYTPVSSVTTVTEYISGTGTVLTAEDFDTSGTYLLLNDAIYRRSSWYGTNFSGVVKITYVAGRFATTAAVDAKFKAAAGSILRRLWAREAGAWARGGAAFAGEDVGVGFFKAVEPMVAEFLGDELRAPAIA